MTRNVTETLACNWCNVTKIITYTHIGTDRVIEKQTLRPADGNYLTTFPEDNFYEIRSGQHICGKCLNAIRASAKPI